MNEFGQLVIVVAGGITTTIGVCVYLLRQQQSERERSEIRSDARLDRIFEMLDGRVKEQTDVLRRMDLTLGDLAKTQAELSGSIRELAERVDEIQRHVPTPTRGRVPKLEVKEGDGNLPPGA